ncbi:MAG: class I SAM-dependent methyltransferase [Polyangiales bacterium]
MPTDYDAIAPHYDRRYALHEYGGIEEALDAYVVGKQRVLELGCGTGQWLARLGAVALGLDLSAGMLASARERVGARVVRGDACSLPFASGSVDGVVIVNALHHFPQPAQSLREAARVLRPGGELLTIGLQPRATDTEWYVYDYFAGTLKRDLERYASSAQLERWLEDAGLRDVRTVVAHRFDQAVEAREALSLGVVSKHATSQLADLSDAAYDSGLQAIEAAATQAESEGGSLRLLARLALHGTSAVKG